MGKTEKKCGRKRRFTDDQAKMAAKNMNNHGHFVHAYKCPMCKNWHVGKVKKQVRVRMAFEGAGIA